MNPSTPLQNQDSPETPQNHPTPIVNVVESFDDMARDHAYRKKLIRLYAVVSLGSIFVWAGSIFLNLILNPSNPPEFAHFAYISLAVQIGAFIGGIGLLFVQKWSLIFLRPVSIALLIYLPLSLMGIFFGLNIAISGDGASTMFLGASSNGTLLGLVITIQNIYLSVLTFLGASIVFSAKTTSFLE